MGTGFPLLAEGQVGALYPPNGLLLWLLPIDRAVNLSIVLHFFLGGLFSIIYARSLGLDGLPAILVGLVFSLCGFLVVHAKHMNMVASAAWLPLFLALIERQLRGQRPRRAAAGVALVTAAMLLAGHPQIAYCSLLVGGLYALLRAGALAAGGAWRAAVEKLALLLAGVVLGLGLAAPQLLPTLELTGESGRSGGLEWEEATGYGYHPRHLVTFLLPRRFGDPADDSWPRQPDQQERLWPGIQTVFWEITAYVGWLPLLLAVVALAWALRRDARGPPPSEPSLRGATLTIGVLTLLCLLLVLGKATPVFGVFFSLVPGFDSFRFPTRFLLFVDLFLAVLAGVGLQQLAGRLRPAWAIALGVAVAALAVADLFWFGRDHNPVGPAGRWFERSDLARMLSDETEPYRVYALNSSQGWERANALAGGWSGSLEPYFAMRNVPLANANLSDRIPSLEFYTSFYPARLDVTRELGDPLRSLRLLGLWNVKYLVSPDPLGASQLEHVDTLPGPAYVYRNRAVQPRGFVASAWQGHPDLEAVGAALRRPSLDTRIVHVEDPEGRLAWPSGPSAQLVPARELSRAAGRVEFEVDAPQAGIFFASELYYPGRFAELDGEPVEFHPANGVGVALALPAGRHRVVLGYRSRPFERGLLVAGVSGLLVAGLAFGRLPRARDAAV